MFIIKKVGGAIYKGEAIHMTMYKEYIFEDIFIIKMWGGAIYKTRQHMYMTIYKEYI